MQILMWRAEGGDPEVPLDPVLGIPWLFSGVMVLLSVGLFAAIGVVPTFRPRPDRSAGASAPSDSVSPPPPSNAGIAEQPPSAS